MRRPSLFRIALAIALAASLGSATAQTVPEDPVDARRAFTLPDFYRVVDPGEVDVSPDGAALVYAVGTTDLGRAKSGRDLWSVPTTGGESRRLTFTADATESSPRYSPDGKTIAFVSQRGDQQAPQIWLLPADGGEARALTSLSTGASEPVWAPDGKRIAFVSEVRPVCGADDACNAERAKRREGGPSKAHVADELLYRHWTSWNDGPVPHVLEVEIETGAVVDRTPGAREAPAFTIGAGPNHAYAPDGTLLFTRNPDPDESLAWSTNTDVWSVGPGNAEGEAARNLTAGNPAFDGVPRPSPDGRWIAFLSQERPGYESDRVRLTVLDRKSGERRDLMPGFDDWVDDLAWLPDSSAIVFTAERRGRTPLFRVGVAGGEPVQIADLAHIDSFVVGPRGRRAYLVRRAIDAPRELWSVDLAGSEPPVRLTFHNRAFEDEVDLRPAERVQVEVAPGRTVELFLILPHGFDPEKRYPAILNVHGGPQSQWSDAFRGDWQMYPGSGYVLAFPNPSGSTGYGQAFVEEISGDWGGQVYRDLMAVTDWLASRPYVDPDRIGAMGWSYGGYMMNWFQASTDRYRALACMMGLFDLRSFHLTTEELWFPEWDLGGRPWDSEQYERWNPASRIESFETPMLIVTGERDFRVPYTQSLMAFTALRRRGVPARLVVMPDSGHWPGWTDMALYYTAHLDWFHRWLGGDPPPWSVEAYADNAVFDRETGERIDVKGDADGVTCLDGESP